MPATLAELTRARTKEEEEELLLAVLRDKGFPVSDWFPGGAARTLQEAIAAGIADQSELIASITAGGFVEMAKTLKDRAWLDLLAEQFYGLSRSRATYTVQRVELSCAVGLGPQTINAGFIVQSPTSGNRYVYQGAAVQILDGQQQVPIQVQAENPGASYNDFAGTITEIVTPLPGLSVDNPETAFGGTDDLGGAKKGAANQGTGTITPSGTPSQKRSITVRVTASGSAGAATGAMEVEVIQGATRTTYSVAPIPTTYLITGDAVTLGLANGVGAGFIVGDVHTFQTPGTPIVRQGTDDETQEQLAARCTGRWPSLSLNIVSDKYVAWIRQCSLENGYGIEKITVRPSSTVAGQTNIYVATASGAPSGSVVTALQNYLNARDGITDTANVQAATNINITLAGPVTVKAADLQKVQAAADANWLAYVNGLSIGGDTATGSPGVVRWSELLQAVMDAGVIDIGNLLIGGDAVNFPLGADQVAVVPAGGLPSVALTWNTVA